MPRLVRTRLAAMMFLFFFAIGAWTVTAATFLMSAPTKGGLNFTTGQVGWVYSTYAIGGLIAAPFVGLLADRLFHAERVLGVASFGCAGFLLVAGLWCQACAPAADEAYRRVAASEPADGVPVLDHPQWNAPAERMPDSVKRALARVNDHPEVRAAAARAFVPLFLIMLAQSVCLQVGLTLCTVLSLRNLPDPLRYARTRLLGTLGWVAAGLVLAAVVEPVSPQPFLLAAAVSAVLGVYAFTLPATPPLGAGRTVGEAFGLPALKLLRDPSFAVYLLGALVVSQMNQFYGVYGHRFLTDRGFAHPERVMTIGQVVEVGCMFALPLLDPRRNAKWLMLAGVVGAGVRGAALAWGPDWAVLAVGVPMHGWSYAFYFVAAASFVDRAAPPHLRASAQAVAGFVGGGLGPWTGNQIASAVVDAHRTGTVVDWTPVWVWPLVGCGLMAAAFAVGFRPRAATSSPPLSKGGPGGVGSDQPLPPAPPWKGGEEERASPLARNGG